MTNSIISLKHLSNNNIIFDIGISFELHRLYNKIKVIKFHSKFVGLNMTSKIKILKLKPYYDYLLNNNEISIKKLMRISFNDPFGYSILLFTMRYVY